MFSSAVSDFTASPVSFMAPCIIMMAFAFVPRDRMGDRRRPVLSGIVVFLLLLFFDTLFVDADTWTTAYQAPACALGGFLLLRYGFRVRPGEAFYCTICMYLLTDLLAQAAIPVRVLLTASIRSDVAGYAVGALYDIVFAAAGYAAAVRWVRPVLFHDGVCQIYRQKLAAAALDAAAYLVLANYQFIFWLLGEEPTAESRIITVFRLITGMLCVLFLFSQSMLERMMEIRRDRDIMRHLWRQQQEQYQLRTETIELINRKCHDLKHQMEALRSLCDRKEADAQLREMENSVMIYDAIVKTGNPVLDTVLTEKSLYCEKHTIHMTCMADGACLAFVGKIDLYTMFGNAIDNAIECVIREAPEKRVIQVSVYAEKELAMIRIRNYCSAPPVFECGLPKSTKEDGENHGFGLRSIRYTAEKYGGGILCHCTETSFTLQILLPMRQPLSEAEG